MPERSTTKTTASGDRSTDTIDDVLNRLGEILKGANQPQTGGNPAPRPASGGGPVPVTPQPVTTPNGDPAQANQMREWLATEVMYLQMLPPITPKVLKKMDGFVKDLPELLKSLRHSPFLLAQIRDAVTAAKAKAGADGGRSTGDAELTAVVDMLGQDVSGSAGGERVVPVILAFCGAIALGRAIYDVTH